MQNPVKHLRCIFLQKQLTVFSRFLFPKYFVLGVLQDHEYANDETKSDCNVNIF